MRMLSFALVIEAEILFLRWHRALKKKIGAESTTRSRSEREGERPKTNYELRMTNYEFKPECLEDSRNGDLKIHFLFFPRADNGVFGNKGDVHELHLPVSCNPEHEGLVGFEFKVLPDGFSIDVEREFPEVGLFHI